MIRLFQYYRIVAAYLILLIHQQFWAMPPALGRLTGVAVPLFAAMSGFLFAKSIQGGFVLRVVLSKKLRRILIPYVIWAVVYWIANSVILDGFVRHGSISLPEIRSWILGGTARHLWFLPSLFFAFVLISLGRATINLIDENTEIPNAQLPVGIFSHSYIHTLSPSTRAARSTRLKALAFDGVIFVFAGLSQFIPDSTSATFAGWVKIYLGRLVFYFVLGSLLSQIFACGKTGMCVGLGLTLIGCVNMMLNCIQGLVWSPLLLVIGLLLIAIAKPDIILPKCIGNMAEASMGIYLVHVLFTSGASFALQKTGNSPLPAVMGTVLSVVLFVTSYLMVRLLPKKCF